MNNLNTERQKILIVDDTSSNVLLLSAILKKIDADLILAYSGQEALQSVMTHDIDLILLDVQMPNMSGFDVADILKKDSRTRDISIIFVTAAYTDELHRIKGYQYGALDYIQKPIDNATLLAKVNVFLTLKRQEKQLMMQNQRLRDEIEERKRTEQALRESESNLMLASVVFNDSSDAIVITDSDSVILKVNDAFTKITGYSADEIVGCKPSVLKSDKHNDAFYQEMWNAINSEEKWEGEIWNKRKNGEVYPEWERITKVVDEAGNITNFIATFTDITEKKKKEEHIHYLVHYDALTGLPNRPLFRNQLTNVLARSKRNDQAGAILLMNIDRFKSINDSLGHDVGDELLIQFSKRLVQCIRKEDIVARLSADEFIVLMCELNDEKGKVAHTAEIIALKMLENLATPMNIAGHELMITASIGVTMFPKDGNTVDSLIMQADTALYRAKESGLNNVQFFEPEMEKIAIKRMEIEYALRRAVLYGQLMVYYQPQIDINSDKIIGAESLLRWEHPTMGMVSPADFIPIAEDSGLIVDIGTWVLESACKQIKEWEDKGEFNSLKHVAVNISARQFSQLDFVSTVISIIEQYQIAPCHLELELTESALVTNVDETRDKLKVLKDFGVCVSVDDFGTGYSSLAYLQKFPIDVLKIDQSFIKDLESDFSDKTIVKTIIAMAKTLDLHVIAEGVENDRQLAYIKQEGCDCFQGYLCSPAVKPETFYDLLQQRNA